MAASYPNVIATFATKVADLVIEADHVNRLQEEMTAVQTGLISGLQHDLKFTDNLFDIGKSGATRPRDLFLSRNATVAGSITTTGDNLSHIIKGNVSFSGSHNNAVVGFDSVATITPPVGSDAWGTRVFNTINKAASGTHPSIIGLYVPAPVIGAGGATVTNAYTVVISGAPTGASNTYALVVSGNSLLDVTTINRLVTGGAHSQTGVVSPALTGHVNDWNISGLANASIVRVGANAAGYQISGIVAAWPWQRITLLSSNLGTNFFLMYESASSSAANRIWTPGNIPYLVDDGAGVDMLYDSTLSRWRVIAPATD